MPYRPGVLLLAFGSVVVAGSAVAVPPFAGERGLAELRAKLGGFAVSGRVERVSDELSWLVLDSGERIGIEATTTPCATLRYLDAGKTRLFEGFPGAVLELDGYGAHLWQHDPSQGCMVELPVFEPASHPEVKALLATSWTPGKDKEAIETRAREAHIDLAARPAGATVRLTPNGLEVRTGDNTGAGVVFASFTDVSGAACGQAHKTTLEVGRDERGPTVLHLKRETPTAGASERDGECDYVGKDAVRHDELWLEVAPDGSEARLVASQIEAVTAYGGQEDGLTTMLADVPGGVVSLERREVVSSGREGPRTSESWTWSFTPPGPGCLPVTLAEGSEP